MIERNKEIARYISQKVVNEKNYAPIEAANSMQAIAAGSVLIWKFVFLL
jgi:hypothetical protein